jgi:hypothetical protein
VVLNADTPDGRMDLDVFFYPESAEKNPDFIGRMQRMQDRVNASGDPNDQFGNAARLMSGMAGSDWRSRRTMAAGKRGMKQAADEFEGFIQKMDTDPETFGATFDMDPDGRIVPMETPKARYVVSLTSAGKQGSVPLISGTEGKAVASARKARRKDIEKFLTGMEPVYNGPDMDRLGFGFFKMPDGTSASLDLNFFTDDLEEAKRIAAATNQVSIWDNEAMDEVADFGGLHNSDSPLKTAEDVQR